MVDIEKGYLGNQKLKRVNTYIQYTQEQLEEIAKCIEDPVYFIKTYVKIVNVDKGLVPFEMWPFQEEMVQSFHNNRFTIAKMPRQVGKTTTAAGYMLHSVIFNNNYSIAILANKGALAREILDRIKYAYEYLPNWLQQGIVVWNKGNIELENGSKIASYATSSSGVRGGSYNLIFLDEFAFVPQNMANEFFTSTYPVISSGQTTKVIIVSTPYGLNHFYKMWTDAVEKRSFYNPIEVHWSMVPGRDEAWKEMTIRNTSPEQFAQEFECVEGNTIIEIYDKKTKEYHDIKIKDFYDFLV
jgi:phage terminase large subunit-like protein